MDLEKFGKHLRKLRTEKGLTQKEFGEKLGVSIQAVSKWEVGRCMPDITMLQTISKELNVNIEDLLEAKDSPVSNSKRKKGLFMGIIISTIIIVLIIGIMIFYSHHNEFEVKMISTTCEDFTLEGFAAYSHHDTLIYITDVDYCGKENTDIYKEITCNLYEDYNDTSTLVSSCEEEGVESTLEEFLEKVEINVTNYSAACKKFVSSQLSLHITALQQDGKKILYEIPIAFEDNC